MASLSLAKGTAGDSPTIRERRRLLRGSWIIVAAFATSGIPLRAGAQVAVDESAALERRLKAVFVFKFAGFVDWPPSAFADAETPIRIAVMGDEAIVQDIADAADGRIVQGRRVQAMQVKPGDDLTGVHLLFLRDSAWRRLRAEAQTLKPDEMLIVTDSADAIGRGSVINFVLEQGRVRFDVSLDAAERRRLRLSSRLIMVARNVSGKQQR